MDNITLSQAFDKSTGFIAGRLGVVLGGSISAITQIVVMLFLLFFLYRDGDLGIAYLRSIVPLNDRETDHLFSRLVDTVRATVMGHFLVAAIQGLAAGIAFASLGISSASLLGVATVFFAMVPSFGAFVVWVPIAIYLAIMHHWIQAGILMAVGTFVISTLDNVLNPVLVGAQLRLHTVPIFLSIVGGISLFGISGLILGPIVFALTQSLLDIWRERLTSPLQLQAMAMTERGTLGGFD
jgi:predicted PurR-regulated permease PerM